MYAIKQIETLSPSVDTNDVVTVAKHVRELYNLHINVSHQIGLFHKVYIQVCYFFQAYLTEMNFRIWKTFIPRILVKSVTRRKKIVNIHEFHSRYFLFSFTF